MPSKSVNDPSRTVSKMAGCCSNHGQLCRHAKMMRDGSSPFRSSLLCYYMQAHCLLLRPLGERPVVRARLQLTRTMACVEDARCSVMPDRLPRFPVVIPMTFVRLFRAAKIVRNTDTGYTTAV